MNTGKEMSKRQQRRAKIRQSEMRSRMVTIGLVVIGALLIAFVLIYPNVKPVPEVTAVDAGIHPQADKNSMGDPKALVKIEEFSDFQCPYCKNFHEQIEPQIVETYVATGKVHFTYRSTGNWVSDNMRGGKTESEDAAKAAYCAGDQNKYWEMHATIFGNWLGEDVGSYTDRRLASLAETAGLDMKQFNDCYDSNKYADQVTQDSKDAIAAGVTGTPSFVLSYSDASGKTITKLIEGAQPFDVFKKEIEAAL
ncbi:MAG: DsbA family protein, partial [Anaerolineales bacterium]|nr:DsbA family protein [Anaerolineales bacterium]